MSDPVLDRLCIDAIRFLSVDAVEKAKSGHPGAPMGAAPMAYVLWDRFLRHNPAETAWPDRDRFVLSAGHASMLLYSLLHLTGYQLSLDEIKRFRQIGSRTPGHPEYGEIPGVEVTTGPLGQGFANGVGMAIAERMLAQRFNRPGHTIVDHRTFAIVSDGDLMEGVAAEAASLAGHLKLGKLIYLYDDNKVSIEGGTTLAFTEDVAARFRSYGWRVLGPLDGMDTAQVDAALREATSSEDRPTLIVCRTTIGYGAPTKAGLNVAHGEPLGAEEAKGAKKALGWEHPEFTVPPQAAAHMRLALQRGAAAMQDWNQRFHAYRAAFPAEAAQLRQAVHGELPPGWDVGLDSLFPPDKPLATREAGSQALNRIAAKVPALAGGSADLAPSTKTLIKDGGDISAGAFGGRNFHFGVREHAMGSICNGLARHGGVIPYAATFLIFSDYMRPPMRLAAMMRQRVIYVFTHDSIGVGEDGPTHQPVEQLMGLRSVPNMVVIRPADATETVEAWKLAVARRDGPTALVLSRQNLPVLDRSIYPTASSVKHGAYILWEASPDPDLIIIATGSEVSIALDAAKQLQAQGVAARVVSMPSWELFDAQPADYRERVLPSRIRARVSIEAGAKVGWERYIGLDGGAIGLSTFGTSAPAKDVYEHLGITASHLVQQAQAVLHRLQRAKVS
ncbi:MAG: transketolase [Dehalococcoidia bacterium]|nr:transketolase [Dehalococcoidia bacterium]